MFSDPNMHSCENCGEVFASKLGLELHYAEEHSNKSTGDKHNQEGETNKKTKEVEGKKKTAYRSFDGLKNIFVNSNMCEPYSLWPQKPKPGQGEGEVKGKVKATQAQPQPQLQFNGF